MSKGEFEGGHDKVYVIDCPEYKASEIAKAITNMGKVCEVIPPEHEINSSQVRREESTYLIENTHMEMRELFTPPETRAERRKRLRKKR